MRTFSVGIVGAGGITRQSHLPTLMNIPQVRVAWIADMDDDRARRLARAYGVNWARLPELPEDLPECEVALLGIPAGVRRPYLNAFAKKHVGVLVEKPFARSAREHQEILDDFPPELVACGFLRRTYASTLLFRRIVTENWFGPISKIRMSEGARLSATRTDKTYFDEPAVTGGGVLAEGGCHALDLAFYITGATRHGTLESQMVLDGTVDRKAQGHVQLVVDGGREIALEYCFSWLDHQPNLFELEFANFRLSSGGDPESPVVLRGLRSAGEIPLTLPPFGARTSSMAFNLEWLAFLRGMEQGRESEVSASSCLRVTALIEDLYLGAKPL